jgi:hypothetical protein
MHRAALGKRYFAGHAAFFRFGGATSATATQSGHNWQRHAIRYGKATMKTRALWKCLAGLTPALFALSWLVQTSPAAAADSAEKPQFGQTLAEHEHAIRAEFQVLERAHFALAQAVADAQAVMADIDPAAAPDRFAKTIGRAIDDIETKASAMAAQFDTAGSLPAIQMLDRLARERSAFLRDAPILEEDRTALLQIWGNITARIADNVTAMKTLSGDLASYRTRLVSRRIAIAEYLRVGDAEAAMRLATDALTSSPTGRPSALKPLASANSR